MTEKANTSSGTRPPAAKKDGSPKKPYDPPRLVSQHVMEVVTGACTPSPPGKTAGLCTLTTS